MAAHLPLTPRLLLAAGLLALALPALAQPLPPRVQDLEFGPVLFEFYQQDHFAAIVELTAAQQRQRIVHHRHEAELLRGGLMLSYGLHDAAEAIFRRLLGADTPARTRNRAWYYLARSTYEKGLYQQAIDALAQIDAEPDIDLAGERQLLAALIKMDRQDYRGAEQALTPWQGSPRGQPFADYNRAIALIRSDRREAGIALLEALGKLRSDDPELLALRDKANVAAAFALLQIERPESARPYLAQVRLEGPLSNQALLLAGLSESASGRHRQALAPWSELQQRPSDDPAVQEALISIPQAYANLGDYRQAVELFEQNIATLEREHYHLGATMTAIESGELIAALALEADMGERPGDGERLPGQRYLIGLLAGHRFHQAFQNYLDLKALEANLRYWAHSIDSFDDMIDTQRARYERHLARQQDSLESADGSGLWPRRQALAERLAAIGRSGDLMAVASREEQRQWQQLRELDSAFGFMPDDARTAELQRHFWQKFGSFIDEMDQAFEPRLETLQEQLAVSTDAIVRLQQRQQAIAKVQQAVLQRLAGYADQVQRQRRQIQQLLPRTEAAVDAHRQYLQELALQALATRQQELDEQIQRARYALAQVHDSAVGAQRRGASR